MKIRTADQKMNPDILIIGSGVAGVAAAVGAISKGATVVIIEKNSFPGGRATASQVGTICGLYLTGKLEKAVFVCDGFPCEFADKIIKRCHNEPIRKNGGIFFLPYDVKEFEKVCSEYLNHPLITLMYNSE